MDIVAVLIYKIATLLVGVSFLILGYRLYLRGVAVSGTTKERGEFSLSFGRNRHVSLKHAGPGVFFCLFGLIIIVVAIAKGVRFETEPDGGTVSAGAPIGRPPGEVRYSQGVKLDDVIASAKTWTSQESLIAFVGKPAPPLRFTDTTGKRHDLAEYHGRVVIIWFFNPLHPYCKLALSHLNEMRNSPYSDEVVILGLAYVSQTTPEYLVDRFIESNSTQVTFPIAGVESEQLSKPYDSIEWLPGIVFVEQTGTIKLIARGIMPSQDIVSVIGASP